MNIFTKNNYFADVQKKNSCVDGGYINKYLWIYSSWQPFPTSRETGLISLSNVKKGVLGIEEMRRLIF